MQSTPHFKTYADLATEIVCGTDDPKGESRPAQAIYAAGTGTAVVRPMGGASAGTDDRTLNLVAGMPALPCVFARVISGTATNVTLFWDR